jgi:hypothetical protein
LLLYVTCLPEQNEKRDSHPCATPINWNAIGVFAVTAHFRVVTWRWVAIRLISC